MCIYNTLGPTYNEQKDAKEYVPSKRVLVVTELSNIVVNDFDMNKAAHYSRIVVVTEVVANGT